MIEILRILATIGIILLTYFIGRKMDKNEPLVSQMMLGGLVMIVSIALITAAYLFSCLLFPSN